MPKALAMPDTVCPMPPSPMMPSFLPNSSKPSGTVPIALLDLHIKRSGVPGQFHEQRHGVLGDGVIAVMQHVADADAAFLGFLKIDVAGDARCPPNA